MQSSLEQIYKPSFTSSQNTKGFSMEKNNNKGMPSKGLFRIQSFLFFHNYDYIQLLGCSIPKLLY